MQIEYLSTSELKPYEGNPRIHNEKQIEKLISSIQEYGFVLPVLIDCENVIIAGHAKVLAALKLNMPEVPCVKASHLN